MALRLTLANRPIQSSHLIVCEGQDEFYLLDMLCEDRQWGHNRVEIVNAGGRENIANKLADTLKQSGSNLITHVALVFDSEESPAAAQKMAQSLVQKFQESGLQFKLFQLPSETECGSLETLIRKGIPDTSVGYCCAKQWEACVQSHAESAFDLQAKRDKAWLQVWLTHRTKSTASSIGYAVSKDRTKKLRQEIDAGLQPLNAILDAFVPPPAA